MPGDYDGDGLTDPAIYTEATGQWRVKLSARGWAEYAEVFGGAGYGPAPADYDGDGRIDLAVYNPAVNLWYAKASGSGLVYVDAFGPPDGTGEPASGYFDWDRLADPGVRSTWGDFILWGVQRSSYGYQYRGQSYQISTERWRVNW